MSAAPARTTVALETAVGLLLGADRPTAEAAAAAFAEAGALGHGTLLLAVLGAARGGTDAVGALRRLAEGAEPASSWSAYELRVAAEEAQDEADAALGRLRAATGGRVDADGLLDAVEALLGGAGDVRVRARLAPPERAFLDALCARTGAVADAPEEDADAVCVERSAVYLPLVDG